MFGIKIKYVKTANKYTLEDFFEKIKDLEYEAGVPSITKHGFNNIITWPALDSRNQVWLMATGKESSKWQIMKNEEAGVGNALKNAALDSLTDGFAGMGGMFGKNNKKCEQWVVDIAKIIQDYVDANSL